MPPKSTRPSFINRALDNLKERMELPSDSALAEHLGVSRQMLSAVRSGKNVPLKMLVRVLDKAGYAVTRDGVLSLLPGETAAALKAHDNQRTAQRTRLIEDKRLTKLFLELDRALEHYAADEIVDAIEHRLLGND